MRIIPHIIKLDIQMIILILQKNANEKRLIAKAGTLDNLNLGMLVPKI